MMFDSVVGIFFWFGLIRVHWTWLNPIENSAYLNVQMCECLYWSHICPIVAADCWLMFCCTFCTYTQLNDDHFVIKTIVQGSGDKSFLFYYFMMNVQYFGCRLNSILVFSFLNVIDVCPMVLLSIIIIYSIN